MSEERSRAAAAQSRRADIWLNLGLLAAGAALLALGLAYAVDALAPGQIGSSSPYARVEKTLNGQSLTIPAAWMRFPGQEQAQFAERLDLKLPLRFDGLDGPIEVYARIETGGRALPSAGLLDSVYAHSFTEASLNGPKGLIGKPLKADGAFHDETVWYDPLSSNPFVAKCMAPIEPGLAGRCLRTVPLDGALTLTLDFPEPLLDRWRQFDGALARELAVMGASLRR